MIKNLAVVLYMYLSTLASDAGSKNRSKRQNL